MGTSGGIKDVSVAGAMVGGAGGAVRSLFDGADDCVGCSLGGAEYDQEFVLDEEVSEMVKRRKVSQRMFSLLRSVDGCPRAGQVLFRT